MTARLPDDEVSPCGLPWAVIDQRIAQSCAAQGIPAVIVDPVMLRDLAQMLYGPSARQDEAGAA